MKFEDALKGIEGADSVGGQLIVNRGGKNIAVGKNVQGNLIVEDTPEARDIVFEIDKEAEREFDEEHDRPRHHQLNVDDGIEMEDQPVPGMPLSSTQPQEYAQAPMYSKDPNNQPLAGMPAAEDADRREALKAPKGSDPNTPKPNTEKPAAKEHFKDDKDDKDEDETKPPTKTPKK